MKQFALEHPYLFGLLFALTLMFVHDIIAAILNTFPRK